MSTTTRALSLGALPLVAVLGLAVLTGRSIQPSELKVGSPAVAACAQPPVFKPGYQRGKDYVVRQGKGYHFGGEAWVEATVCSAGTLAVTAYGELGGVEEPQLTVALNGDILASITFDHERTVQIQLPEAGEVIVAYLNDFYATDSRVIFLRDIKLSGTGCQDLQKIQFVKGKGIDLDPAAHTASLASGVPLTFTPCRAGELQVLALGRKGRSALPILKISEGGAVLYQRPVGTTWRPLRLNVQQRPLTLQLVNPYWKTLADRNLIVSKLNFTPNPPSAR
ncbi:hypothetical protein E7T09_08200 [Deinococcus sp. KSM4-11]|uniref:hypothetical protein n=1 Tax=Deinococcus sp. KSM4-11 TaxID=2568654 RepID=UPI0010A36228|nr:hypothetical protein [Deinococcus sp. KSM4-11]THF87135.1 hypothetical protein E7T09_08200 [Deinococcus sp. KSM4-11]